MPIRNADNTADDVKHENVARAFDILAQSHPGYHGKANARLR